MARGRPSTSAFAVLGYLLLWDATAHDLSGQGAVAVAINAALVAGALVAPASAFLGEQGAR